MKLLNFRNVCGIGLILLSAVQTASADDHHRSHQPRPPYVKHWQTAPPPPRRSAPQQNYGGAYYPNYYQPGYSVNPLPYGANRLMVNAMEYFYYNGYFYRPSGAGYVIVNAPFGAVVAALPSLHHRINWQGVPYYVAGNTIYQKHPNGYRVVPNPGINFGGRGDRR